MRPDQAKRIIIKMLVYFNGHIGTDELIQLDDVAIAMRTSKKNLNWACKLVLGVNAYALILQLKMQRAYYFSNIDGLDEQEIARILVYSDPSSLCHAFKKHTGMTLKTCTKKDLQTPLQLKLDALINSDNIDECFTIPNLK
ncbi:MAG: helix-turn-helix transcriptional regulator [Saprospiraceae bacterium]|nr:helix-turn-helix transcriptional regulator [Saprospiraceae bacterium]